ncbi:hypothetical protein A3C96_00970 [Candidatus Uhrbacteria bacterium RIFCSPHIGHO2_02_FULL_60_10]|uniref:Type II secretion system protein GspG C-terminal domain-containing protein n=1 Tax=Candidatus Uhrbacteria bacterium RIFCSPHIGHO2_02_FULL_60_10 TaxID=1802392 RepID=A0A1F7U5N2_9BACT|nr:MAG: hypothetical protein A3C96_00970 [Candidatus Uhrbacteria bacterium RIFCSPHIGHO2_02_FULL_60_10]
MPTKTNTNRGFTLIELLIVIAIIGFLAAAILVAVDPVKRIQDSRNSKRWSEVNGILNAILTKQVDDRNLYNGESSAPIIATTDAVQVIVSSDAAVACEVVGTRPLCPGKVQSTAAGKGCAANLSGLVSEFIAALPVDPKNDAPTTGPALGAGNSGYYIQRIPTTNRIEIGSCWPDQGASISVRR